MCAAKRKVQRRDLPKEEEEGEGDNIDGGEVSKYLTYT